MRRRTSAKRATGTTSGGPASAGEFLAAVDDLLDSIARNPRAFPNVHRGLRRAVLRRFPYVVYFSLATDEVIVLACLHGKQSLERLRRR